MGNVDWNPTQTRVFDVYMAGGADQAGGHGLMDIFSCNSGSNGAGGPGEDNEVSNKESRQGSSSSSSSSSASVEDMRLAPQTHSYTHTHNNTLTNTHNSGALGVNLIGNNVTNGSGINTAGPADRAVPPGNNVNSASSPPLTDSSTELYNTGTGRTGPSLTPEFFNRLKRQKVESQPQRVAPALNLQSPCASSSMKTATSAPRSMRATSTPPAPTHTPLSVSTTGSRAADVGKIPASAAYSQTDKWPSQMESAFVSALRIIIKNGTSKFKILDRNYGRNELISLYVEYHTGEVRTKKQISSHIQVWKKSILNKMSGNFKLSSLDHEMLNLIEDGAPQSEEANKFFFGTFEQIVKYLSQQRRASAPAANGGPYDFFRPSISSGAAASTDYLLTPATSHNYPSGGPGIRSFNHGGAPLPQLAPASAPVTPIDYAKSIYGNLKTYKCVPVKVQEPFKSASVGGDYHNISSSAGSLNGSSAIGGAEVPALPPQYIYGGSSNLNPSTAALTSAHPLFKSTKDVELQQRQLIDNLSTPSQPPQQTSPSAQPQPLKLPPVSSELYARVSPTQSLDTVNPQLPQLPQLNVGDFQPQIYVPIGAADTGNSGGLRGTKRPLSEV